MRAAMYARVSTDDQTVDNQLYELWKIAQQREWDVVEEYIDQGISGAKGRDKRPALDKMLKAATRGKFDIILVWSVDRLGRSLQHLVSMLADLDAAGVGLYLHQQALDTTTPSGKAMFQMCGVFAEFERSMIRERVMAGLARAHAKGKKSGRRPLAPGLIREIKHLRSEGLSIRKIAQRLDVSPSAVHKYAAR